MTKRYVAEFKWYGGSSWTVLSEHRWEWLAIRALRGFQRAYEVPGRIADRDHPDHYLAVPQPPKESFQKRRHG